MKAVLIAVIALFSFSTFAGTSDTLTLQGTVAAILDVVVTPDVGGANTSLDLKTSTPIAPGQIVASVHEKSNSSSGYSISISSANGSKLLHTNTVDSLSYSLTYGGAAVVMPATLNTAYTSGTMETDKAVGIVYTGNASLASGVYSDTITFTIAAQ